ncbi:DUF3592 domain-containing protein [Rhodoferax sp.]|uniref:DUF3592 domain-containing protein n=1 Tax=Rhodoferax sp. TaxID=50421 RepID=UPI003784CDDB
MQLADRLRRFGDISIMVSLLAIPLTVGVLSLIGAAQYGLAAYKAYVASRDWRATEVVVVKASAERDCGSWRYGPSHSLDVEYTYKVDGTQYSSKRIWFGNGLCSNKAAVEIRANGYPRGARMSAYYDPNRPSEAVLIRGTVENGTVFGFFCMLFFGLGSFAWLAKSALGTRTERSFRQRIDARFISRQQLDTSVRRNIDG